jgi:lipoyl(octanoyl) transferase
MINTGFSRCLFYRVGRMAYADAVTLQESLVHARIDERISDIVLVGEHPPTVTLGRHARRDNILLSESDLAEKGVAVCQSSRGGDVTFHCPGQIVLYPVMDLSHRPGLLRGYIHDLEDVAIRVLSGFGVEAERWSDHPGLWCRGRQIGAIGLHMSRGVSMHGMSLNVHPDLNAFDVINLCGLAGMRATSIEKETGRYDITMDDAVTSLLAAFAAIFRIRWKPISKKRLLGVVHEPETAGVV